LAQELLGCVCVHLAAPQACRCSSNGCEQELEDVARAPIKFTTSQGRLLLLLDMKIATSRLAAQWVLVALKWVLRVASSAGLSISFKGRTTFSARLALVAQKLAAGGALMQLLDLIHHLSHTITLKCLNDFCRVKQRVFMPLAATALSSVNGQVVRQALYCTAVGMVLVKGHYVAAAMPVSWQRRAASKLLTRQWSSVTSREPKFVRLVQALPRGVVVGSLPTHTEGMSQITDWLFVGSSNSASQQLLQQLGITHVLNLCKRAPFTSAETQNCRIHLKDDRSQQLAEKLPSAFQFLHGVKASGGRCLVHCQQGVSRSVSVVLAYFVMCEGLCLREAWQMVRRSHPAARPNRSFCEQLIDMDFVLHGSISVTMADFLADRLRQETER